MPLCFKVCLMRNHQGFTLIELMVTISVAAIIMALAVPSMKLMQANARMASAANDLASDLKKTRSDAISYRTNYTFVPNGGTNWSNGWLATYNISDSANAAVRRYSHDALQHDVPSLAHPGVCARLRSWRPRPARRCCGRAQGTAAKGAGHLWRRMGARLPGRAPRAPPGTPPVAPRARPPPRTSEAPQAR